jgi:hypothetical protein
MDARKHENLIGPGSNDANFILVMGQHDGFEGGAVGISDRHKDILRLRATDGQATAGLCAA